MDYICTCTCVYMSRSGLFPITCYPLMFGSSKRGEASEGVQISAETPGEVGSRCVWFEECELKLARTIYMYVHVHVFT